MHFYGTYPSIIWTHGTPCVNHMLGQAKTLCPNSITIHNVASSALHKQLYPLWEFQKSNSKSPLLIKKLFI
jgi:hypothetical protein